MASPLLVTSEGFRKKILVKNLTPYNKSPRKIVPPVDYPANISDLAVKDSPDDLIDTPIFAKDLYTKNQYGAEGGYKQVPDPGALLNTKSNQGEYGPGQQDAHIVDQSAVAAQTGFAGVSPAWKPLNAYSNGTTLIDSAEAFSSLDIVYPNGGRRPNAQPYPTTFNPSSYSPISILLSPDPQGSDGLLSSDSYIARLGATILRKEFEVRIATEIRQNTIGRANIFNTRSGTDLLNIVTGRVPLIEPNYRITVPANPVLAATDFALRLAGSILPVSPIIGSYWDTSINSGQPTTIQQLNNAFKRSGVGRFFSRVLGFDKTGSQLFLNNTGGGQKSRLFDNLDYNRYKPNYPRTILDRLGGAIVGTSVSVSDYYVGSITSDPSRVFSPGGDLPVDSFAREVGTPVYGPTELAQLYEGPSQSVRLGANGPTYGNGGGIEGGFTWVSPKYRGNAGKKVGPGGEIIQQDEDFKPSSYNSTESTNNEFRDGSILDDTQRIIDSQPAGGRRLQHVGNAIDQVSKVFHDGYKEITKGSKIIKYTGSIGQEVGYEYCRIFTKDVPYLQYNDLQKVDGITTSGRKISYSVLDNTYNLNIFPNKKDSAGNSTNLVGDNNNTFYAKKYMFSIENLAWRTSSTPGYTVSDLPVCERGSNGGRVMWFPPYDLKFSESNSASWKDTSFIGRPEPIYTYSNTRRTGTLSWKIVVDHPSVLNLIVNKVLTNETNNSRIDNMINSFFAGCLKYDLYELAEKYPLANPNELYNIQRELDLGQLSKEQLGTVKETLSSGNDSPTGEDVSVKSNTELNSNNIKTALTGIGFYFENEQPTGNSSFSTLYETYIIRKPVIVNNSRTVTEPYNSSPQQVESFFDNVIKWNYEQFNKNLIEIYNGLLSGNIDKVTFNLAGTTSSSTNRSYNRRINESRIESIKTYINAFKPGGQQQTLGQIAKSRVTFVTVSEESTAAVKSNSGYGASYMCGEKDTKKTDATDVNTVNAMACRRIVISSINVQQKVPVAQNPANSKQEVVTSQNGTTNVVQNTNANRSLPTKNLSKKVLRLLLSECDYFESIKEDTPMVYDNLKEKLKFFNPAFHSTTPEGLNSRLTFLNQCLRPGETIPVVKSVNGKTELQYNNAVNTSFGAPPVLVLRVGDFYNTKIIPDTLNITYEGLDLNPEGIGVQPMIANVSLSFKFVGGSGIKDAVDRLQNALSFNYYANTEVYDDRAEATGYDKTTQDLDTLFASIYEPTPAPPTTNEVQNNDGQKNNGTIGEIISSETTENGISGQISYDKYFSTLSDKTQEYFRNVVNKNKEVLSQYNEAVRQVFTLTRNYADGEILGVGGDKGMIFGKPANYQSNVDTVLSDLISDIQSGDDKFIEFISSKGFSNKAIRALKNNYKNFIIQKKSTFSNALSKIVQDFTILQQNYVIELAKLNIITYGQLDGSTEISGTDGYQEKNNNIIVYYTSGTSLANLVTDAKTVRGSLIDFARKTQESVSFNFKGNRFSNTLVRSNNDKFKSNAIFLQVRNLDSGNAFDNVNFQRQYFVLNSEVVDLNKYQAFKSFLIDNIINTKSLMENGNTNLSEMFDEYWSNQTRPIFVAENESALEFINYMENNTLKEYINYTALIGQKDKTLFFSNNPNTSEDSLKNNRKNLISSIGKTTNSNTKKTTFNDEEGSINITKVKLN
jgi:hypothetical protein